MRKPIPSDWKMSMREQFEMNLAQQPADRVRQPLKETSELFDLVTRRFQLAQSLKSLSLTQLETVDQSDGAALLGIIARREGIVDQLSAIQQALLPFANDDPEQRTWTSPEQRALCQQQATETDQLLRDIMQMDNRTLQLMCERRDALASELSSAVDSVLTESAYNFDNQEASPSVLDVGGL
jgi:hypothetical protein